MKTTTLCLVAAFALTAAGCGGVADHLSSHRFSLQLLRNGQTVAGAPVDVAIRTYSDVPFSQPQPVTTDSQGRACADFRARWSSAFVIIPPVGNIPRRAPKPHYLVTTIEGGKFTVAPSSPDCEYRWHAGSWQTVATLSLP